LKISRTTVTEVRHLLQANAEREQTTEPLSDLEIGIDEMFQDVREKGEWRGNSQDPPRCRANKRLDAVYIYENDRPPVCAVIERGTRQVRSRVMKNTQGNTLCPLVEHIIQAEATLYTDVYDSYNRLKRIHPTVWQWQSIIKS